MRGRILARIMTALLIIGEVGCTNSPFTPPVPVNSVSPPKPVKRSDADDPMVKEARADTEAVLDDLLAGEAHGDTGLARLSQKLRGFKSWSIKGQEVESNPPKSVKFDGTLTGPMGDASFVVLMVKQQNGKWMIGTFTGPESR